MSDMAMPSDTRAEVRDALERDPRVAPETHAIGIDLHDGELTLTGEVSSIAVKKLAFAHAAAVPGIDHVVDRLRVTPAERMDDGQVRILVRDALLQEPALSDCILREWVDGRSETVRRPPEARGAVDVRVEDGVVALDGELPGLSRKRLAGVLAWWVPGTRDVMDGLTVSPPADDSDDEITEAVTLVLEKDPFVSAVQIRVGVRRSVVTLTGAVPTASEREMAEDDAWYVFGVDEVVNQIAIGP